jgi:hypothetical protein
MTFILRHQEEVLSNQSSSLLSERLKLITVTESQSSILSFHAIFSALILLDLVCYRLYQRVSLI